MTSLRQNPVFITFASGICLDSSFKTFFMFAMPIPVQTKVHFKDLQFLVTYDMFFLGLLLMLSKRQ